MTSPLLCPGPSPRPRRKQRQSRHRRRRRRRRRHRRHRQSRSNDPVIRSKSKSPSRHLRNLQKSPCLGSGTRARADGPKVSRERQNSIHPCRLIVDIFFFFFFFIATSICHSPPHAQNFSTFGAPAGLISSRTSRASSAWRTAGSSFTSRSRCIGT